MTLIVLAVPRGLKDSFLAVKVYLYILIFLVLIISNSSCIYLLKFCNQHSKLVQRNLFDLTHIGTMGEFNVLGFCQRPEASYLSEYELTKDQWKFILMHFSIPYTTSMTLRDLRMTTVDGLISKGIFSPENKSLFPDQFDPLNTSVTSAEELIDSFHDSKVEKKKVLKNPNEEVKYSAEELKDSFRDSKVEEKEVLKNPHEESKDSDEVILRRLQIEKEVRLAEIEAEQTAKKFQMQMETEIRLAEIQAQSGGVVPRTRFSKFDLAKQAQLVPHFNEDDPESFFRNFEKTATQLEWPKQSWTWLISTSLKGKASLVYSTLDLEDSKDYEFVKTAILTAYTITEEGYRQNFRNLNKSSSQTYVEFAAGKLRFFKKWISSSKVTKFDELVNLIVFEEFKRKIPLNVKLHLEDRGEKSLTEAAKCADVYSLVHKGNPKNERTDYVKPSSSLTLETREGNYKKIICSFCKKPGHHISDCWSPHCKNSKHYDSTKAKPFAKNKSQVSSSAKPVINLDVNQNPEDAFEEFKMNGSVALTVDGETYPVCILRDTGSAQSMLVENIIPNLECSYLKEKVVIKDLTTYTAIPLVEIYLKSPVLSGKVKVGVIQGNLPVPGVTFLLGNDLAGRRTVPNPVVVDAPLEESPTKSLEEQQPDLFPVCVTTRSQAYLKPSNKVIPAPLINLSEQMSRDEFLVSQKTDPTLQRCWEDVAPDLDHVTEKPGFYLNQGVLMRLFRPSYLAQEEDWSDEYQIVVPSSIRNQIISMAHDGLSGHLGVQKTYKKLLSHYFWPGMRKSISEYVKSCHTCQMVGKPNQPIPPAPLTPVPIMSEPFEKVMIDCVGPLPPTRKGSKYLLTIMCTASRFPIAIPLKNITARNIVNHLLLTFANYGIPKILQSDQGTNFTSDLFKEVMKLLNINAVTSSPYHPESQGALERAHQTLKSMLKRYCFENDNDWDEGLPFLLFAFRECKHESLGFSPFQLLFGREVRGPLKITKDYLLSEDSSESPKVTVQTYINNLRDKLKRVRELAQESFKKSQEVMKHNYDKKAKFREFQPGDQVLVFLPLSGSLLAPKFQGPYQVVKKLQCNNYLIATPDRRRKTQKLHINLLKSYKQREDDDGSQKICLLSSATKYLDEQTELPLPNCNMSNSDTLSKMDEKVPHLTQAQKKDLTDLLQQFPRVTQDTLGRCTLVKHEIRLIPDAHPIKQAPYRLNPEKRRVMQEEVNYLLDHGLAEPSRSPWASPCLLAPKPGGQFRLCTDYRKLNAVTIQDSYPLPLIDSLVDSVGQAQFVTKIDLQKGYYQVALTEASKDISAFVTPDGLFQYTCMPFGLSNAPATFQRVMNFVIRQLEGTFVYLDDLLVVSNSWEVHLTRLSSLLQRLEEAGFTINLPKSNFGQATVTYLGHVVGQGQTRPKQANIEAILDFPRPSNKREVQRFIGMCGFYRRFCPNFSTLAASLTDLTSSKVAFKWTSDCEKAFLQLKALLSSSPVLRTPDLMKPFVLHIDASNSGVGAVLSQYDNSLIHPVCYYSAKLKKHQEHYSVIEKECLALVLALQKFACYLQEQPHPLEVFTDHNPLRFLDKMKNHNQRLMRWSLLLQPYHLLIRHVKGNQNVIADALSRSPHLGVKEQPHDDRSFS